MPQMINGHINKQGWMGEVLNIQFMKLTDIIWPSAHNCGMDKKAPNYEVVIGNWTTCQNDSFGWQLSNGARVFDIRLGYRRGSDQDIFYFHHNGHQSHRVLEELIDAVLSFLAQHSTEFIILDFHALGDGDKPFNFKAFNDLLIRRLGPRIIPLSNMEKSIGELKRISDLQRIVMRAPASRDLDEDYFGYKIPHKWNVTTFTDADDLKTHITSTLNSVYPASYLWSLSATSFTFLGGPIDIKNHINDWFHSSRDWITRCSIINTDFIDESEIVRYCWVGSSMKGAYIRG
ncbi:phospholipase [Pseudomonas brassicacearum]|uniref:Phospholipase n=1 Tax=Pseudomonas brassicacearum TaxID=930166 RepID=A0A423H999_9PSED|nr:phospholipase [Pseudomonas brassicacearum]RON09771.1 phospholipase [Pseudomonas brassicacearum]